MSILFIVVGLTLLLIGGNIFVDCLLKAGKRFKISPLIMGTTVASVATTLPEIIIGVISAAQGSSGLAVGNSIGSMISNIALVCGLFIALVPMQMKNKEHMKFIMLFLCWLVILIAGINYSVSWIEGIIMLVLFVLFMVLNFLEAKREKDKSMAGDITSEEENKDEEEKQNKFKVWFDNFQNKLWGFLLVMVLSGAAIGGGAYLLVEGATKLAGLLSIPENVIGLTVLALGTSLPELVTMINSVKKKAPTLALGNLIGASVINGSLVLGLIATISHKSGVPFLKTDLFISIPVLFLCIAFLYLPILFKGKTYRWQGIILTVIYILYIINLVTSTIIGFTL